MKSLTTLACTLLLAFGIPAANAQMPAFKRIAPPMEPSAIPIYGDALPGKARPAEVWDEMSDTGRVVRNVTRPTITPFLPPPGRATGAAVIVAPGGGFSLLSMDTEGWNIAQWLADHGIAAFVLKYRVMPTPDDEAGMGPAMIKTYAAMMSGPGKTFDLHSPEATADVLRAIKLVRSRAQRWKIDPARVGVIGFSAGAIASLDAALSPDPAVRPAFLGYVYGSMKSVSVPVDAPPLFAALANDDPLMGKRGFGVVDSWLQAGRPAELHAYEKGSHGFGAGRPGTTTTLLLPQFEAWLVDRGIVVTPPGK